MTTATHIAILDDEVDITQLLAGYLQRPQDSAQVNDWLARLASRRRSKEGAR